MMNKDIEKNRDKIDTIDNQVFDLLIDRLDAVTTIGYIKKQEGLPVLDQNREKIEKDFGSQLMWEPLPESRACRIKAVIDLGGWQDEDKWEEVHNKLIENCINLKKSFDPIIKDLVKKY